jgi:GAF domain-containing protein
MISVPLLIVPLELNKKTIGTINLSDSQSDKGYFTSRDQKILIAGASQTAIAIKRIYLFQELKQSKKETEEAFYYTVNALARGSAVMKIPVTIFSGWGGTPGPWPRSWE